MVTLGQGETVIRLSNYKWFGMGGHAQVVKLVEALLRA